MCQKLLVQEKKCSTNPCWCYILATGVINIQPECRGGSCLSAEPNIRSVTSRPRGEPAKPNLRSVTNRPRGEPAKPNVRSVTSRPRDKQLCHAPPYFGLNRWCIPLDFQKPSYGPASQPEVTFRRRKPQCTKLKPSTSTFTKDFKSNSEWINMIGYYQSYRY